MQSLDGIGHGVVFWSKGMRNCRREDFQRAALSSRQSTVSALLNGEMAAAVWAAGEFCAIGD
jgi:hypothetical protein